MVSYGPDSPSGKDKRSQNNLKLRIRSVSPFENLPSKGRSKDSKPLEIIIYNFFSVTDMYLSLEPSDKFANHHDIQNSYSEMSMFFPWFS